MRLTLRVAGTLACASALQMPTFVRFGAVKASRVVPPTSQWYYSFEEV